MNDLKSGKRPDRLRKGTVIGVLLYFVLVTALGCSGTVVNYLNEASIFNFQPYVNARVYLNGHAVTAGSGRPVKLIDNREAMDPTYDELLHFLKIDDTEMASYIKGEYVCTDFAENLHNNAEIAGIRTAYVIIK